MKSAAVGRVAVALLLSLALLISAAAQKVLANSATFTVAAAENSMPLLEETMDAGDENLPAPGPSYLQPTSFCPVLSSPASKRSVSQTTDSAKNDLKLYELKGVLLI